MKDVAVLSEQQRKELFAETAAVMNTVPVIIEKDFWVVWVLAKLFGDVRLKSILQFKGGTSLSKAYDVIGRFSEDIDLILDWREVTQDEPQEPRSSKTQQNKFNTAINNESQKYIREILLPVISELLEPQCRCAIDKDDPHSIHVAYPALNDSGYLRPQILLEIGPLASWTPSSEFKITSYAAQCFPNVFSVKSCTVPTILAKRTFWEKATILHQEAHRPTEKKMPSRYSRHYYDLALLAKSDIKNEALADRELLSDVVAFKQQFYPSAWARYDLAKPNSFRLMPSEKRLSEMADDYGKMKEMIFAKKITFDEIVKTLKKLEVEINLMNA